MSNVYTVPIDELRQRLITAEHTAALYMSDVSVLMACVKESCEILGVTEDSEDDWPKLPTFIQGLVADRDRYRLAATMEAARTRNECKLALNRLRRRVGEKLPANLAIGALDGVGGDPVVEHVATEVAATTIVDTTMEAEWARAQRRVTDIVEREREAAKGLPPDEVIG